MEKYTTYYSSPIGLLEIQGTEEGIHSISFQEKECTKKAKIPSCLQKCVSQLDEYFHKKRKEFSIPFVLEGSDFQKQVWGELSKIPYGKTVSYKEIAIALKNEQAFRAVGGANGKNPMPILIPCHRVVSHNGNLGGYSCGIWRKKWLLSHEGIDL